MIVLIDWPLTYNSKNVVCPVFGDHQRKSGSMVMLPRKKSWYSAPKKKWGKIRVRSFIVYKAYYATLEGILYSAQWNGVIRWSSSDLIWHFLISSPCDNACAVFPLLSDMELSHAMNMITYWSTQAYWTHSHPTNHICYVCLWHLLFLKHSDSGG